MYRTQVALGLLLFASGALAQHKAKPLSDSALDHVTAAGVTASAANGVVSFSGQVPTVNGLVTSTGTLALQSAPVTGTTLGTINLSGSAQQNMNSVININAVNSQINVLLNLNVNINSTVGSILQSNLSGKH